MRYRLVAADGRVRDSDHPGTFGGHRRTRIYGRLDCPSAARAIARGGYVSHRVFFADEDTALAAGYRPCARCLPEHYRTWKSAGATQHDHVVE
ncbi:MAG: Ada metal-binding domain-containing protein [Mycobacterium sp.]